MTIRCLIVIGLLASIVTAAAGQGVEVRDHPDAATEVLWTGPEAQEGIYRSDGDLLFVTRDGPRTVHLDGTVMTEKVSESATRIGVLLKMTADEPLQLRVFSNDGTPELLHELPHHSDDPLPQIAVPDGSGEVIYARPAAAEVCFVRGNRNACASLFKDAAYTHERNVFVEVTPDGRNVIVAAQRDAAHPDLSEPNAFLFLFDRAGTLLWRRPLPEPAVRSLGFSPASLIVVSTYDAYAAQDILHRSRLVNLDGESIAEAPYGADVFAFGEDEILLVTTRHVAAFNLPDGTSRLVHSVDSERHILSAASGGVNTILLTGRRTFKDGHFVHDDLRLLRTDNVGVIVGEDNVSVSPQRAPRLEVSPNAEKTSLILDRETHLYTWPR